LKKRVKAAPYFPALYVGYDHSLTEREGLKVSDNISLSGGDVTIGPEDNDYNYYGYLGRTVHARAVWKLDEIIFNRNHLLIESERRELLKLRPHIFANGGDRNLVDSKKKSSSLNSEAVLCERLGIKVVFNVGKGGKLRSSTELVSRFKKESKHGTIPFS